MAICSSDLLLQVSLLHSDLTFTGYCSRVSSRVPPSHPGYVFENLPGGGSLGIFYALVRVFLSIELTLTFPIVFKPAADVAEEIWYNFLMVSLLYLSPYLPLPLPFPCPSPSLSPFLPPSLPLPFPLPLPFMMLLVTFVYSIYVTCCAGICQIWQTDLC